jgi:hypothetical protein
MRLRQPLIAPLRLNAIWARDFMTDTLYSGRAFRRFNVMDEGNREVLGIELPHSIPSLRVIRAMEAVDRAVRQTTSAVPGQRQNSSRTPTDSWRARAIRGALASY